MFVLSIRETFHIGPHRNTHVTIKEHFIIQNLLKFPINEVETAVTHVNKLYFYTTRRNIHYLFQS